MSDDGVPISLSWWMSFNDGSRFLCEKTYTLQVENDNTFQMDVDVGMEECVIFEIKMPHIKTRGDARRLVSALGFNYVVEKEKSK